MIRGKPAAPANAGNDTLLGAAGGPVATTCAAVRSDDLIFGDNAVDLLFGDLGDDTMSDAGGADIFHIEAGSGVD